MTEPTYEPPYPLRLDLSAPNVVVIVPLEGRAEVQSVSSRDRNEATWAEIERMRDYVEEDELRAALVFAAFALADLDTKQEDDDGPDT